MQYEGFFDSNVLRRKMILLLIIKYLLFGLIFAIGAWIAVHILAFLGIFIIIAYALCWVIFPGKRFCLFCRQAKDRKCKFCEKNRFTTAICLNMLVIFIITLVSAGIVFGESKFLLKLGFPPTPKTVSFVIPAKGQYRIGEIFPMQIAVSGVKVPINAVQADIGFDPAQLEVVDIVTDGSFANIFLQKEINNSGGWARLTGGLPNPGYFSDHGTFCTIYFKTKVAGLTRVNFLNSSLVLANDGKGSDVLKDFPSVSYLVIPEKISKQQELDQEKLFARTPDPSPVLGVESSSVLTPGVQLKFFDDTKPVNAVLGTETAQAGEVAKKPDFSIIIEWIQKTDEFILASWLKYPATK